MYSATPKDLIAQIDGSEFKSLFKTKPFLHASAMVYNWLIIVSVIYIYQQLSIVYLYPLAVLIIGARMHGLAVLMHDATHFRFLKNRKWNDIISNVFIMYPIFTAIEKYRNNHLKHHQHLNTEDDPDWVAKLTKREFQFPKSKAEFLLTLSSYLILYQGILDALWFLKRYGQPQDKKDKVQETNSLKIAFYLVLFSLLTFLAFGKRFFCFGLFLT